MPGWRDPRDAALKMMAPSGLEHNIGVLWSMARVLVQLRGNAAEEMYRANISRK
ncbi:MAG TPA: hypothetical protein VLN58_11990 [Verrucomicrobiae bacterium]|nr:hypothetical protein [Verrucomicrobiae bacterium]